MSQNTSTTVPEGSVVVNQPHLAGFFVSAALAGFIENQNANVNEYACGFHSNEFRKQIDVNLKSRGTFGKAGRPVKVSINSHVVQGWPNKDIFQYDVSGRASVIAAC